MHIHLDAHMHFHKHIKQASLDAPSHHRPTETAGTISYPIAAVGVAIAVPDRPLLCSHADTSAMNSLVGLCTPAWENLDVTTVTERQRCFRHCAHRAALGRGRVRPGSKAPDSEVQPPRQRRRATTPSVEAALHTSRARVGEVPRLRRPLCVGSAAALRAASATHLQRKREHPSPAGDHKHPTAIRRQPYLDVEESKSDFAAGRGLRQLVLDD